MTCERERRERKRRSRLKRRTKGKTRRRANPGTEINNQIKCVRHLIGKAGGGVGTRVRTEGVAAIGPRCESGTSEQGCKTRGHVRHVRQVSEGVRGIPKGGAARAVHVLTLHWHSKPECKIPE